MLISLGTHASRSSSFSCGTGVSAWRISQQRCPRRLRATTCSINKKKLALPRPSRALGSSDAPWGPQWDRQRPASSTYTYRATLWT